MTRRPTPKAPARRPPPSRKVSADNPNTAQVALRVEGADLDALDAWVEELNAAATGPKWTRSDVLRALLKHGLRTRTPGALPGGGS